ncbi:MAG TPA: hypothetical protein G4N94_12835 [Caldilineae bacterium]|nr:hypothetical protein [Caldilineae bacterium]
MYDPNTETALANLELSNLDDVILVAKLVARRYYEITGKPLGITGEIGEHTAASLFDLALSTARQAGYDATTTDGRRVQIKTRRVLPKSKPSQRVGRIRLDKEWDSVMLVLIDAFFEPIEVYEAYRQEIENALREPGSKARNERGQLSISKFKSIGNQIWKA